MMSAFFDHPGEWLRGCQLARVTSVQDPDQLARVKVRLLGPDPDGDAELWARVAAPFAGAARGAFFIPDVDDEVLVAFVAGDVRFPVVLGGLWNGGASPPEQLSGANVDRWTITGKAGTRIAIIEENGQSKIEFKTPGGVTGVLTDEGGGKIEFKSGANTITMDSSGVSIQAGGSVKVQASDASVTAGSVKVDAGIATFTGVVKCETLIATSVVASTYTPGAGNVW